MPKKLTPRGQAAPPVEPNIGPPIPKRPARHRNVAATPPPVPTSETKYVRNLHHIQARVTLTTKREIMLEPRGQRGDVDIVTVEEREDPYYIANLGLIFELIEPEEAKVLISKQQINANSREHPIWAHLRNEQGQPYAQRVLEIEEVFERQGTVVGRVDETPGGRFTDKNFEVSRTAGPNITEVPGSPGHPATEAMLRDIPSEITPEEYHEFLLFRQFKEALKRSER